MTNRVQAYLFAALIFLADQVSKWFAAGPLGLQLEGQHIDLLPIFDLTRVHNYGISLGLAQAQNETQRWLQTRRCAVGDQDRQAQVRPLLAAAARGGAGRRSLRAV